MSKFKVGDKVEIVCNVHEHRKGQVKTINRIKSPGGHFDYGFAEGGYIDEENIKLVKSKPSKKQRIETLEKEVSELKLIVHELRERKETAAKIKSVTIGKPSTDISVEDKQADVIEFEGAKYRKVDRKAREGDVVSVPFKDGNCFKPNKIYGPVFKGESSLKVKADSSTGKRDYEESLVYNDFYGRTLETVDVYELITEPSTTTTVEDGPKSPNQLRAAVIEKAKLFVKNQISIGNCNVGEVVNGEHGHLTFKFYVNPKKHTVVFVGKNAYAGSHTQRGTAKCNPSDVFNEHIGKAIALGRALGLDVSEFEQAVQPNEFAKGQIIKADHAPELGNHEIIRIKHNSAYFTKGSSENFHYLSRVKEDRFHIINDTNAIYGGVE